MNLLVVITVSLSSVACGRSGFDLGSQDARRDGNALDDTLVDVATPLDVTMPDDSMVDAAPTVTLTFGERSTAEIQNVTADTYISNDVGQATFNFGTANDLRSEGDKGERILLRFDVSAIPSTATVVSATLEVEIINENPNTDLEIHEVLESWSEGTMDGTAGAANYTMRNTAEAWTNAGCGMPTSAGPVLALLDPRIAGPVLTAFPKPLVQAWVDAPAQNLGFVLYNNDANTARIASSEETVAARPLLTITYVP